MRTRAHHARRWLTIGLLFLMILSIAVPTFALPNRWYKKVYVHKNPTKMTYEIGDYMDLAGLVLWGDVYDSNGDFVFTNESMNTTDPTYFKYSPAQFDSTGKQKVTFSCWVIGQSGEREWLSTSVTVTVKEKEGDPPAEWYTDIFVATQPKKTVYTVGESFSTSGLSISGHVYNAVEGKKHTVTKLSLKDIKISPKKFTKAGQQEVKLSLHLLSKSGEYKWFSTTVQVQVENAPIKITKHPLGETVNEGGSCGFTARADNDDSLHWFFTKGDAVIDAVDAPARFPGLSVTGTTKEHLKLSHIPASLDGWFVYCVFYGNDSSATSDKAGITVISQGATAAPVTETPAATPEAAVTTPTPTAGIVIYVTPAATATAEPTAEPAPEEAYAQGIHCTINGQARVEVQGETMLTCVADTVEGFVFDHWDIDGQVFAAEGTATFLASRACTIRACYHERRVLTAVNCYVQLLTKKNNASGTKYTEFDFEDAYYNPVTKAYCPGGTLSCYVTAVVPRNAAVDYWLINGVKYQFPDNRIFKFRLLDLNEATTIEPVFQNAVPTDASPRPDAAAELEQQATPRTMRCINCSGQFMNASGSPKGTQYTEFAFELPYTDPVTGKALPGGQLDIYLSTKAPHGYTVEAWRINGVTYEFPQTVTRIRVMGLNEDTTYEVLFRGVNSPTSTPLIIN